MLRARLIIGFLLALSVIGLMVLDAYLTTLRPPPWVLPGLGVDVGSWLFNGAIATGLIALAVAIAAHELVRFVKALGFRPAELVTQIGTFVLVAGPWAVFNSPRAWGTPGEASGLCVLSTILALAFLYQALRHQTRQVIVNVATTMFILLYTGGLGQFLSRLRMETGSIEGIALLLFSLLVVKMTDIGAFFTGMAVGRHHLIPWLSPKKTWEGLFGGVVLAMVTAVGVGHLLHLTGLVKFAPTGWSYILLLTIFGALMAAISVVGDLAESLLKRDAAVKDSGHLPGFGGVLDLLDSPLAAAPVMWFFWTHVMPPMSA